MENALMDEMFYELGEKTIVEKAYGCVPNMSSIYSELITATGRLVEHYASDLLIDIAHVKEWENEVAEKFKDSYYVDNVNIPTEIYYFGLRECGVDHLAFIKLRAADNYRRIYRLSLNCHNGEVVAELKKVKKEKNNKIILDKCVNL